jgi:hypothetical protein
MDRSYEYLLKKYETRQPGEIWSKQHNQEYEKARWYKEKINQLETLINELHGNFIITPNEKERMKYLIKHLNLHNYKLTIKQQLLMIIIYVKLENNTNRQLSDYQSLLHRYELTTDSFNRFHFKITQHYIDNYG